MQYSVTFCNPECNISIFVIQFFTMHETLHTYRFWVFGEKNTFPSFHASWRRITIYHNNIRSILEKCWSFVETIFKAILQKSILFLLVTWHDLPLFQSVFPKVLSVLRCIIRNWSVSAWLSANLSDNGCTVLLNCRRTEKEKVIQVKTNSLASLLSVCIQMDFWNQKLH